MAKVSLWFPAVRWFPAAPERAQLRSQLLLLRVMFTPCTRDSTNNERLSTEDRGQVETKKPESWVLSSTQRTRQKIQKRTSNDPRSARSTQVVKESSDPQLDFTKIFRANEYAQMDADKTAD